MLDCLVPSTFQMFVPRLLTIRRLMRRNELEVLSLESRHDEYWHSKQIRLFLVKPTECAILNRTPTQICIAKLAADMFVVWPF